MHRFRQGAIVALLLVALTGCGKPKKPTTMPAPAPTAPPEVTTPTAGPPQKVEESTPVTQPTLEEDAIGGRSLDDLNREEEFGLQLIQAGLERNSESLPDLDLLRENPAVLYLLTTPLIVALVIFDPPVVALLEPRIGYLLMRMIWMVPLAALLACFLGALRTGVTFCGVGRRGGVFFVRLAIAGPPLHSSVMRHFRAPAFARRPRRLDRFAAVPSARSVRAVWIAVARCAAFHAYSTAFSATSPRR